MAQRPQPSLRLADGGNFITRWAQNVMRPENTEQRLRQIEAPPPAPVAQPAPPPAPRPPNPNATPDNPAGIRFQDGGQLRENPVGEYMRRVGEEWSRSNADFERGNPGVMQRVGRAVNPLTGFGSNVGAMYDAAGSGDVAGMALAAGSSIPTFAATRTAKTVAGPLRVVSTGDSAVRAGRDIAFGVGADHYTPGLQDGGGLRERERAAGLRFQDGGIVPGKGRGDKIPAKYEPGEFVVSNDMIADNPGLREQLSGLRAETLAARGKTVEEADAKALNGGRRPSLRAADGFDPSKGRDLIYRPNFTRPNGPPAYQPPPQISGPAPGTAMRVPPQGPNFTMGGSEEVLGKSRPSSRVNVGAEDVLPKSAPPPGPTNPGMANPQARAAYADMARGAAPTSAPIEPAAPKAPGAAYGAGRQAGQVAGAAKDWAFGAGETTKSVGGAFKSVGGGLKAAGATGLGLTKAALTSPIAVGAAGGMAAYDGFNTDTETYAKRFGMEGTEPGVVRDLGLRALGVASDLGDSLLLGLPGKYLFRDKQDQGAEGTPNGAPTAAKSTTGTDKRVRPDAQPAAAGQSQTPGQNDVRRIDRPGQSPLFTNMPDEGLLGNDKLMGRGAISPQNMAAADNLAATDSLRSQGAAMGSLPTGTGIPAMPPTLHSGNSWEARNNLRNLEVGASSIYDSQSQWGNKAKGAADVAAFQNAQAMDTAARTGSDPGSVSRNSAQASMFDSKTDADASRYSSDNSLRGTMYSQLGAKHTEMQQRLQQQQLRAAIFREAGGKPEVAAKIAASYGMDAKDFTDMAAAEQTRAQGAATSARKRLEGMAVRDDGKGGTVVDPGRVANLERTLTKMAPGWQHMSEPEQAELYGKAESSVNLLEGLNDRRNNSFWQSIGVDGKSASLDNLPDMKGGRLTTVKLLEGATTGGGVSRGDYALEVGGHKLYLPRDKVNQGELELLKARGVDISGMQK